MGQSVHAAPTEWQVTMTTRQVNYTTDSKTWLAVKVGDVIPNKAWVSTGPKGRVQLSRGVESVSFQPNTLASITTSGFFQKTTEVRQQTGTLDLEIEKRSRPHTTVQTPYLAAVVKGTHFIVTADNDGAAVMVAAGCFASGILLIGLTGAIDKGLLRLRTWWRAR